jgi:rhodanese-related sulfurtransferase
METYLEFTSNHPVLVVLLLISFFLLIFSELRRKASGLINIDPTAAVSLINQDAMIIDLRNKEAYSRGHIVNAKNIPLDEFDAKRESIQKFKSKPVVAVCDSGISSTKIVNTLRQAGFEKVFGLKGGMNAWDQAGLPVVTGKKTKSRK